MKTVLDDLQDAEFMKLLRERDSLWEQYHNEVEQKRINYASKYSKKLVANYKKIMLMWENK